jgi:prepilin-type N-terminal cleavage/methylation domain-containing protein
LKSNLKKQTGFSLIEVVVTLFIIGVIFVIYQVALNGIFLTRNAKDQEVALRVATHKVEELRSLGYFSLPASGAFTDSQLSSLLQSSASMAISDYNLKTKQITVTVSWKENNTNVPHSLQLNTLISQDGGLK